MVKRSNARYLFDLPPPELERREIRQDSAACVSLSSFLHCQRAALAIEAVRTPPEPIAPVAVKRDILPSSRLAEVAGIPVSREYCPTKAAGKYVARSAKFA